MHGSRLPNGRRDQVRDDKTDAKAHQPLPRDWKGTMDEHTNTSHFLQAVGLVRSVSLLSFFSDFGFWVQIFSGGYDSVGASGCGGLFHNRLFNFCQVSSLFEVLKFTISFFA